MRQLLALKVGKEKVTFSNLILPREPGDAEADYQNQYKYKLRVVASDISSKRFSSFPRTLPAWARPRPTWRCP